MAHLNSTHGALAVFTGTGPDTQHTPFLYDLAGTWVLSHVQQSKMASSSMPEDAHDIQRLPGIRHRVLVPSSRTLN